MGRHGVGRHGVGRHGVGRHGVGRHGVGRHGVGRHGVGRLSVARCGAARYGATVCGTVWGDCLRHGVGRLSAARCGATVCGTVWGDCLRNLTVRGSPEKAVAGVCVSQLVACQGSTQPLSNVGDGCCPWLRHGHLGVLAGRKDEPVSCWFSGGDQRTKVDVLVGLDGGLDFGVQCSPQDQEGSHVATDLARYQAASFPTSAAGRWPAMLGDQCPGNRVLASLAVA